MSTFDPSTSDYCGQLADGDPSLGFRHKLVLTYENWSPNWTLPGDDSERVLVCVGPFEVPGRGPDPTAGFSVQVLGGDDTEMSATFDGPDRRAEADAMFDLLGNWVTRSALAALGFVDR